MPRNSKLAKYSNDPLSTDDLYRMFSPTPRDGVWPDFRNVSQWRISVPSNKLSKSVLNHIMEHFRTHFDDVHYGVDKESGVHNIHVRSSLPSDFTTTPIMANHLGRIVQATAAALSKSLGEDIIHTYATDIDGDDINFPVSYRSFVSSLSKPSDHQYHQVYQDVYNGVKSLQRMGDAKSSQEQRKDYGESSGTEEKYKRSDRSNISSKRRKSGSPEKKGHLSQESVKHHGDVRRGNIFVPGRISGTVLPGQTYGATDPIPFKHALHAEGYLNQIHGKNLGKYPMLSAILNFSKKVRNFFGTQG